MVSIKNDSKEGRALKIATDMQRTVSERLTLLRQNGWNVAESDFVKASSLYDRARREDLSGRKYADAEKKFTEAGKICDALIGKLVAQKLSEIDGKVAELELQGDHVLRKKLELIKEIIPIDPANKDVLAAKQKLEDVLYPRMKVSVVCEGKDVSADFVMEVPLLKLDGPCFICKDMGKKSIDKNCLACRQRPKGRKWLEVYHALDSRVPYSGDELLLPVGTKVRAPKDILATKGDVLGVISVQYVREDGTPFSARTGKIVANWVGETNVVLELKKKERIAPGTVRVVPLPRGEQMEFVWCPAGSLEFEYREPVSGQLKQGQLSVNKGFWISKFEVTCAQAHVKPDRKNGENSPARMPSRRACLFARNLQNLVGGGVLFRLPTAAEWEIAARYGGVQITKENVGEYAWLDEPGEGPGNKMDKSFREWRYHNVGEKKPNKLGLYDMFGNMEEWAIGTIDSTLGLKVRSHWISKCGHCGEEMVIRGGSVRTPVTNALSILTRDYATGRLSTLDWQYYCDDQCKNEDRWGMHCAFAAIRLVADELPSSEE